MVDFIIFSNCTPHYKQTNGHNGGTNPPQLLSAIASFNVKVPEKYQQLLQKKKEQVFGRDSLWSFPDVQPRNLEKKISHYSKN